MAKWNLILSRPVSALHEMVITTDKESRSSLMSLFSWYFMWDKNRRKILNRLSSWYFCNLGCGKRKSGSVGTGMSIPEIVSTTFTGDLSVNYTFNSQYNHDGNYDKRWRKVWSWRNPKSNPDQHQYELDKCKRSSHCLFNGYTIIQHEGELKIRELEYRFHITS